MKDNKLFEWDNKKFEYSDKKMKELLKSQNKVFEMSKFKFKKIANTKMNKVKKVNYKNVKFEQDDFTKQSRTLYIDELNNLTLKTLVDVANNSYNNAFNDTKKYFLGNDKMQEKEPKEISERKVREWNDRFIKGLRTSYNDTLLIQSIYLAYRLSNAFNENLENNKKNIDKDKKEDLKNDIINMNSVPMLSLYKIQKKKFSNTLSNAFADIVSMSMLQAYIDLGIEKVIRVAELDSRTCELCEELDGEVYTLGEEPEVLLHNYCRCYYMPYIERKG